MYQRLEGKFNDELSMYNVLILRAVTISDSLYKLEIASKKIEPAT
jgi:hypothetical protein